MAFSIADLLSFLSGSAEAPGNAASSLFGGPAQTPMAQAMAESPAVAQIPKGTPTPIAQAAGAGAGRGVLNPPMVNPASPRPQALQPLPPPIEVQSYPVASVNLMPPDTTPDNRDAGGGDRTPMMAPVQDAVFKAVQQTPGIFSRLMDDSKTGVSPIEYLLRGFTAAGTPDPARTMMQFAAQDTEAEKVRQAKRKAAQGETKHISGSVFGEYGSDGKLIRTFSDPLLAAQEAQSRESKLNAAIEKAVLDDRLARGRDAGKADIKAAEDARPVLNDIQGLRGRWQQAQEIVSTQGTAAQLQGIPGIAGIAGFFGGDQVAANKFLEGLTVDETLLNTARTKGAISNQEMSLFKSPIPSLTDDREKVWKPWIEKRLEVLGKLEDFYKKEVERGNTSPQPGGTARPAGAAPQAAPGGMARPASKAEYDNLPPGTQYVAPDGKVYTKK